MCSSSVVSVALLRIMGKDVAELPLVSTLGDAQGMVNYVPCLEKVACFGTVTNLPYQYSTIPYLILSCVSYYVFLSSLGSFYTYIPISL